MRAAFLLLALAACSTPGQARPPMEYPGALQPPSSLGADFMLRQKISAVFGETRELSFEAVLQKVGDQLKLLGLTPFGSRAFLLEQNGTEIEFTNYVGKELPFPPKYILLDIQRTLRVDGPRADGTHELEQPDELVREIWKEGRILERRIRRKDGRPPGELVITYEGGMPPGEPPPRMRFDNGWFGYRLTIETIETRKL